MDFEVKRQAILDSSGRVLGYEFFLKSLSGSDLPEDILENKLAVITLRTLAEYGIRRVGEGTKVFVGMPLDTLLVRAHELLSPQLMGYKLHRATVGAGKTVFIRGLESIEKLRLEGATVFIHYSLIKEHPDMVQLADAVEFSAEESLLEDIQRVRSLGKEILISGIDEEDQYKKFAGFGSYFQGEYVNRSEELQRIKLAPFLKSTLLRLLVLMNTAQTPNEFAKVIETDIGLSAKLLRFINSAFFALRKKVISIEQAAVYFGLKNIKNFILVLAMNDYAAVENPLLWRKSLVRAKLMEEFSKNVLPDKTSEAYLVGLFSLIDRILDVKIPEFLMEVNVDETIISAFTDDRSVLAKMLNSAILIEESEGAIKHAKSPDEVKLLKDVAESLNMKSEDLMEIAKRSYIMADTIIHL
jgi:EAL and modified HD-GYP domain-containing signal transduction protein